MQTLNLLKVRLAKLYDFESCSKHDLDSVEELLVCCFRNSLLSLRGFKHLTRTLNFVQNIFSLCVPNVPGRLSIA